MFSKDAGSLLFERNKIIDLAHLFGHSTIDAVLDLSVLYFTVPEVNGFIAYRLEAGCAIVFGPPVCLEDEMLLLLKAFHQHFQEKKTNIVYLIVTEDFAKWAEGRFCASAIEFGAELFVNPKEDTSKIGAKGALLRKKLRRAFKEGVSVAEYFSFDTLFETQMEKAAAFWLSSRKGPQIHTASVKLFEDRLGRRWFYAKQQNEIMGLALLNRLEVYQGWVLSQVFLSPKAPVGTSETLVNLAIETLAKEGCPYLSFGAVPAEELGQICGLSSFSCSLIRMVFKMFKKIFRFDGKKIFWQKFQPLEKPAYVLFASRKIKIKDIVGLSKAVNARF